SMSRPWVFVLCFLLFSASGLGQSTSSESQGMQALVAEVRQLREDLHTTNGYALKAQVLLYRLQVQEATVARVSQHLNDVRSKLAAIQEHQRQLVGTMKYYEKIADDSEASPAQQKEAQQQVSTIKTELPSVAAQEQQAQTAEMEAEEQLRAEQAKLDGLASVVTQNRPMRVTSKPANEKARDIDSDGSPYRLLRYEQCLERSEETTSFGTREARMALAAHRASHWCTS